MLAQTKYLGEIEISEESIIHFPTGLPGFIDERQFALLDFPGNDFFQLLQSLTTPDLAFVVTDPYAFYEEYAFDLDDQTLEILDIEERKEVLILVIVTINEPFEKSTLNLKAPLVLNIVKHRAKQYILQSEEYIAQAPIVVRVKEKSKGEGNV